MSDFDTGYRHFQSAHCETGMTAGLICHAGGEVTESLALGAGAGLSFIHLPFVKFMDLPLLSFRSSIGSIFGNCTARLGIEARSWTFRDPEEAMSALDGQLEKGVPVGLQVGMHWLPYLTTRTRVSVNSHMIVVAGKKDADYLLSDVVMGQIVSCPGAHLRKARFSRGPMAPRGKMVIVERVPRRPAFAYAASRGIRSVCSTMLQPLFPWIGVKGIRFLADRLERWPDTLGADGSRRYLGHCLLMQEDLGTGGAGFRYMFAAFLQEAAGILHEPRLLELSARLTATGDRWRAFGIQAARHCTGRSQAGEGFPSMAALLREIAGEEEAVYRGLKGIVPKIRSREVV